MQLIGTLTQKNKDIEFIWRCNSNNTALTKFITTTDFKELDMKKKTVVLIKLKIFKDEILIDEFYSRPSVDSKCLSIEKTEVEAKTLKNLARDTLFWLISYLDLPKLKLPYTVVAFGWITDKKMEGLFKYYESMGFKSEFIHRNEPLKMTANSLNLKHNRKIVKENNLFKLN